jgi:hypothetical protein
MSTIENLGRPTSAMVQIVPRLEGVAETTPIEIWFEDEARIGRRTARFGSGPSAERDLASLLTSVTITPICSAPSAQHEGFGAAPALPYADTDMMQVRLDEI